MKKTFLSVLPCMLFFLTVSAQKAEQIAPVQVFNLSSDTVYWQIPELNLGNSMKFSDMNASGSFNNDVEKDQHFTFIISSGDIKKEYKTSSTAKLVFPMEFRKDGVSKMLKLIFWPDLSKANYDDAYIKNSNGQLFVAVPEVYELCQVALALTLSSKENNYPVSYGSDYYNEVQEHFGAYKNDPLIQYLRTELDANGSSAFYSLSLDAYRYAFDKNDKLTAATQYAQLGSRSVLEGNTGLWEAFSKISGFRDFYAKHASLYNDIITETNAAMPFADAWPWIEKKLNRKINSFRISLSPLTNSFFRRKSFTQNKYSEAIFFGNGFNKSSYKNISEKAAQLLYTSSYFNAAIKSYVPLMAKDQDKAIVEMFSDYDAWAETGRDAFYYPDPKSLFDEYLAQAFFLLYVKEKADGEYRTVKYFRDRFMKQRGFKQFDKFYSALLKVAEAATPDKEIPISALVEELKK